MDNTKDQIPEIDLKLETKTVEAKTRVLRSPYVLVTTPYAIVSDEYGTRRVWIDLHLKKMKLLINGMTKEMFQPEQSL